MYLEHFGLTELPFGITPDTRFTFESAGQKDIIDTVLFALRMGEGFIKIVGEVGAGKTHACRRLLHVLHDDPAVRVIYLPNPAVTGRTLLLGLCADLGLNVPQDAERDALSARLMDLLLAHAHFDVSVVAMLDEAQALPDEALETVRLLSNLETERTKLLRVVMFGQPELERKLAQPHLRQLAQRIAFHHTIAGLSLSETIHYIDHRLRVAGCTGAPFDDRVSRAIHLAGRGLPRLINVLAHKCLVLAAAERARRVDLRHVLVAVRDTPSARALDLLERTRLRLSPRVVHAA
jgi:MSHA biogenesis protein MshM